MELIGKTPIPPLLFYTGKAAGYTTWTLFALKFLRVVHLPGNPFPWLAWLSCAIFLAGLAITCASFIDLGRANRLGLPTGDTALRTGGIYRLSRNPMYLGFDLLTLASALYLFNATTAVLGAYSLFVYHLIILGEERFLEQRFGGEYYEYRSKVRRYI